MPGMLHARACSDRPQVCRSCREAAPQPRASKSLAKYVRSIDFDHVSTACPRTRQHAGRVSTVMVCWASGVLPWLCKAVMSVLQLASAREHARAHVGKHGRGRR